MRDLELAEEALEKGNAKSALRNLNSALAYGVVRNHRQQLEHVVSLATKASELGDGKRSKEAERVIAQAEQLIGQADELERRRVEAAEATRRAQEEEYRAAARQRLEVLAASRGSRDVSSPRSIEYAVMELDRKEAAQYLTKAGSLGWELVTVLPGQGDRHVLYMKRDAWLEADQTVNLTANAMPFGKAAVAAGGGMAFAGFYYESGPDFDADGDVDGGLFDNIENLFG